MIQSKKFIPFALAVFAVFITVASAFAMIFTFEILNYVLEVIDGPALWWAASARLLLAVLLWFSARASRTPITFRVLAILTLMAAVLLVVIGPDGVIQIIGWFSSWPLWGIRLPSALGLAFGLFLLWSVSDKRVGT